MCHIKTFHVNISSQTNLTQIRGKGWKNNERKVYIKSKRKNLNVQ